MSMRVTHRNLTETSLANLNTNKARLSRFQQQLSSGKVFSRPSDSPTGTSESMSLRSQLRANEQFSRSADDAQAWLGTQDTALQSSVAALHQARELALRGMNTGTASPQVREALASEISGLREQLLGYANANFGGRPVFGGTTDQAMAFSPDGTYAGDGGRVPRRLGESATVRADTDGVATFGSGDTSVFAALDRMAADLRAGSTTLGTNLTELDAASGKVLNALTDVGTRYARVVQDRQDIQDKVLSVTALLAGVEDIDLPRTITELKMQETAYQAALGATGRVLQPTLMDFLR